MSAQSGNASPFRRKRPIALALGALVLFALQYLAVSNWLFFPAGQDTDVWRHSALVPITSQAGLKIVGSVSPVVLQPLKLFLDRSWNPYTGQAYPDALYTRLVRLWHPSSPPAFHLLYAAINTTIWVGVGLLVARLASALARQRRAVA